MPRLVFLYMEHPKKLDKIEASLANERTLLAYIRTSASAIVLAAALFKFFQNKLIMASAIVSAVAGITILILGIYRYIAEQRRIRHESSPTN